MRRLFIAAILFLLVGAFIFFWNNQKDDQISEDVLSVSFALNEGGNTTLKELVSEKNQPLVVNFWATWCAPCLEELPMFESVHNRIGHEVTFLGVNVSDSPTKANELIADAGISYQMGRDPEGNFLVGLGIVGLPATVFIDSEGTIVDVHMGQISDADLDKKISWVHK
ncbi:MAG: TlpA disulfide reductase family protein [Actinomycetota bacterium]|nr:TlpA disulfide reductase family protein [Actinomycetota bacterium]